MRTGSNYITSTILKNFIDTDVFVNVGGWKHGKLIEFPNEVNLVDTVNIKTKDKLEISKTINLFKNKEINFIIIIKNPYMWILSISIHKNNELTPEFVLEHIKLWNEFYSDYKEYIENDKAYLIKYEKILQKPIETLNKLANKFNLIKKGTYTFENKKLHTNTDSGKLNTTNIIFDKTKYINPNISEYLSKDIITIINNNIDISLLKFYEYDLEKV